MLLSGVIRERGPVSTRNVLSLTYAARSLRQRALGSIRQPAHACVALSVPAQFEYQMPLVLSAPHMTGGFHKVHAGAHRPAVQGGRGGRQPDGGGALRARQLPRAARAARAARRARAAAGRECGGVPHGQQTGRAAAPGVRAHAQGRQPRAQAPLHQTAAGAQPVTWAPTCWFEGDTWEPA